MSVSDWKSLAILRLDDYRMQNLEDHTEYLNTISNNRIEVDNQRRPSNIFLCSRYIICNWEIFSLNKKIMK